MLKFPSLSASSIISGLKTSSNTMGVATSDMGPKTVIIASKLIVPPTAIIDSRAGPKISDNPTARSTTVLPIITGNAG
ncbi:hypothetical protein DSECCO2_423850 [anaerobic digester metagenome]